MFTANTSSFLFPEKLYWSGQAMLHLDNKINPEFSVTVKAELCPAKFLC